MPVNHTIDPGQSWTINVNTDAAKRIAQVNVKASSSVAAIYYNNSNMGGAPDSQLNHEDRRLQITSRIVTVTVRNIGQHDVYIGW